MASSNAQEYLAKHGGNWNKPKAMKKSKKSPKNDHDADDMKMKAKSKGKKKAGSIKMSGKFDGKSNKLGQGGRAAQLQAQGVPGGVIGNLARAAQAAPGQRNFHKSKKGKK
jgi:hypothetical protein